jgi:hypothetical protein
MLQGQDGDAHTVVMKPRRPTTTPQDVVMEM